MTPSPVIGKGTYGQVFLKDPSTVTKVCNLHLSYSGIKCIELTTITELAVLCKDQMDGIPNLGDVTIEPNGQIAIDMEYCGETLLQYAKTLTMQQRIDALPKIAFQLIESAIALQNNGVIHNDIKSANVMVNKDGLVKLIDFGLCAFEVVKKCNQNLISKHGTTMSKDWGTYTISPPETFTDRIWSVNKYMPWSIGITLCEFLFKTHSFLCDCVLEPEERVQYKKYYKNDQSIKQVLYKAYFTRMQVNHKYIADFNNSEYFTPNIANMLKMMLTLDFSNRASLNDLYTLPMFDEFKQTKTIKDNEVIPSIFCNVVNEVLVQKTISPSTLKNKRLEIVEWLFGSLNMFNKLHLFVQSINLFDRYCSLAEVDANKYYLVAFACMYLTQHIVKQEATSLKRLMECLKFAKCKQIILFRDVIKMANDILCVSGFDIYFQSFDVIIAKNEQDVDMNMVLKVMKICEAPYNNAKLISKYIDCIRTKKQES